MPRINAHGLAFKYEQQGAGEPLVLIPYLATDHAPGCSLEVFDSPHPAGQWVPSGENLGHQHCKPLAQKARPTQICM